MLIDIVPYVLLGLKILLIILAAIFIWSGLDELFFDVVYLTRKAWRTLIVMRRYKPLSEAQLLAKPEQPIAITIPCWDESAVIRRMLENTLRTINYSNYHIFVGTYPNDPATQREVELAREEFGNVHRVVCPKDGPTNKADCLNWVHEGIKVYEKDHDMRFEIFVMEDSEDIIHPLTLKLFNYLIPRMDMVQLPVFPMPVAWNQFTPGHYMDEFAENHARDMIVREVLSGVVPSAGVGSAYSRRALEAIAADNNNQLFNIDSLTEDYDFGMRLRKYGLKQVFVRQSIDRRTMKKSFLTGRPRPATTKEYIVIREFFPRTLRTAIRQKSRWVVGIALQGWAALGWSGDWWNKYMLYRDRKALLTNQANMIGNILVPVVLGFWAYQAFFPQAYRYPPLVEPGTLLWTALWINLGFLFWRALFRVVHVWRIYGPMHGLMSFPRLFWGNLINFFATMRAIRLYIRYLVTGKFVAWDKTAHVFPSEAELREYRRRLGDLLLDRRFVTVAQLDQALSRQKATGEPLGQVLLNMGVVGEGDLLEVLGAQCRLETRAADPFVVPLEVLRLLPRNLAVEFDIFPLGLTDAGILEIATLGPLPRAVLQTLETRVGRPIQPCLVTKTDLSYAIRCGYARLKSANGDDPAGDDESCVSEELRRSRSEGRRYLRLGDILTREGMLTYQTLEEAKKAYVAENPELVRFGEFLVNRGFLQGPQLEAALALQRSQ